MPGSCGWLCFCLRLFCGRTYHLHVQMQRPKLLPGPSSSPCSLPSAWWPTSQSGFPSSPHRGALVWAFLLPGGSFAEDWTPSLLAATCHNPKTSLCTRAQRSGCRWLCGAAHAATLAFMHGIVAPGNTLPNYCHVSAQDTAAISYRWSSESHSIGMNTSLNMSKFQIRALLSVLRRTSLAYVWIDRLAVPQFSGVLQYTLLSRMMAVYCGAHCVVAVRTREGHQSRYHQRAWTLQVREARCIAATMRFDAGMQHALATRMWFRLRSTARARG